MWPMVERAKTAAGRPGFTMQFSGAEIVTASSVPVLFGTQGATSATATLNAGTGKYEFNTAGFAQGTPDYPDRSTTLVIAVPSLAEGEGWTLRGPGIDGIARLTVGGLPAGFSGWLADNRSQVPLGVDLVFVAGDRVAALPRSTAVTA